MEIDKQEIGLDSYLQLTEGKRPKIVLITNAFVMNDDTLGTTACDELRIPLEKLFDNFKSESLLLPEQRDEAVKIIRRLSERLIKQLNTYP